MTPLVRTGVRLIAVALLLVLAAPVLHAAETATRVHPWKAALARRMAQERFEQRDRRERREEGLKRLAREQRRAARTGVPVKPRTERARPARPDDMTPVVGGGVQALQRQAEPMRAQALVGTPNRLVNDPAGDVGDAGQSETAIVGIGDRMVAAWNDGQGFQVFGDTQGWAISVDGGETWQDRGTPPRPTGVNGFVWTSDPVLTLNERTGAVYYAGLCDFTDPVNGSRSGVALIQGTWSGNTFTWGTPVIARSVSAFADFVDKQWIAADSVSGRVHLVYTRFPASLSRIEHQWADANLGTFSAPRAISLDTPTENGWVQAGRVAVDGDGRVFVMYYLIGQGEQDFYRLCRSTDLGNTFSAPATIQTLYTNFGTGTPGFNRPIGIQFASLAVDRSHGPERGRLYLSWAESINWLDDLVGLGGAGSRPEAEGNGTAPVATPFTVGQTLRGSLSSSGDVDFWSFPLAAGQHLIAAADSVASGTEFSLRAIAGDGTTALTFTTFDATINPSVQNPDGFPSGWMFTAPVTGTYFLRIGSRLGTGAYRLRTGFADRTTERGRDQRDVFVSWSDDGVTWSAPTALSDDAVGLDSFVPEVAVTADGGAYCAWFDYRDAAPATNGGQAAVYVARSDDGGRTWATLGAMTDTLSQWSGTPSNIEPNQGDYLALFANDVGVWSAWADARRGNPDVFVSRLPIGTRIVLQSSGLAPGRISLAWRALPADTLTARLYRAIGDGAYEYRDVARFDAAGSFALVDTNVTPGLTYSYRLGRFRNGVEVFSGQVRVLLPSEFPLRLARVRPNPVVASSFEAYVSLAVDAPAELLLYDITGREVARREVSAGLGDRLVPFPLGADVRSGLYLLRLRQGSRSCTTRVLITR